MSIICKFGLRLRHLRLERQLTQAELGDRAGMNDKTISNIERGRHGTSFRHLENLANALNVELAELFRFEKHQGFGKAR